MKGFICCSTIFSLAAAAMAAGGPVGRWGLWFGALYVAAFIALAGMVRTFPETLNRRDGLVLICFFGLLLRGAFAWFPISTDVNRYVWEGFIQLQGVNPYALAPDSPALLPLRSGLPQEVWVGINHKEFTAAYPPLALLFFRLLAMLKPDPQVFKLVMSAADAAVLIPLSLIFYRCRIPPARLLWYAANPLLLVFIAGEGHLDSLMVLLLVTGCALVLSGKDGWGFFVLGCAAMTKYFAWLAILFLLRRHNLKKAWLALVPAAFFFIYADPGAGLFLSLTRFGTELHYNDALTAILRLCFGPLALPATALVLTIGLGLIFLTVHDRLRSIFLALGCLLLCLPTLHPWYLALIAPFAALFASTPWLVLQASAVFTFPVLITEYATGTFQEIYWLKAVEYLPFYILLLYGLRRRGIRPSRGWPPPRTLSVVIPTLNEEKEISGCLGQLGTIPQVSQMIVSDGGSVDATRERAEQAGAVFVAAPKGRGCQIREGIRHAGGDVILVLHADTRLDPAAPGRLLDLMKKDPQVAGGAFAMRFDGGGAKMRLIAGLNNMRTRLTGIAFGDQGQFFRARALAEAGGFPDLMLMEDVELSIRFKEVGPLVLLPLGITVSQRRWEKKPIATNTFTVIRLLTAYLLKRRLGWGNPTAGDYYTRYYGNIR